MIHRASVIVAIVAIVAIGCARAVDWHALPKVPVDPALAAVSRSSPEADARTALKLCVREGDVVAGMAHLASARDVHKYMLTNGREPELQVDEPVWMVQLAGEVSFRGRTLYNPVCVVINGEPLVFAPYGSKADGPSWAPPADFVLPVVALPALAP